MTSSNGRSTLAQEQAMAFNCVSKTFDSGRCQELTDGLSPDRDRFQRIVKLVYLMSLVIPSIPYDRR